MARHLGESSRRCNRTGAGAPYRRRIARTCFHHTDRETLRSCTRCERPACYECLTDAPVGAHCWECVRAARPPAKERLRRWSARTGPVVTKVLVGLNLAVFVLTGFVPQASVPVEARLVLLGPLVADGEWHRLVTSGFVHFGLFHLGLNMVFLWQFGPILEDALGRARFVGLYLASLLGGSLGVILLSPLVATAGASGALFGLVGAYAVGLRHRGISVWDSGVGGLIAVNLLITFAVPGISIGGHLGGLVSGAAFGSFLLRSPTNRRSTLEGVLLAAALSVAATGGAVWAATG